MKKILLFICICFMLVGCTKKELSIDEIENKLIDKGIYLDLSTSSSDHSITITGKYESKDYEILTYEISCLFMPISDIESNLDDTSYILTISYNNPNTIIYTETNFPDDKEFNYSDLDYFYKEAKNNGKTTESYDRAKIFLNELEMDELQLANYFKDRINLIISNM